MFFNIFYCLLVLSVCRIECHQFRYDYNFNQDIQSWIKLHQVPATWMDARLRCQLEGAILASPHSTRFTYVMMDVLKNTHAELTGIFTGVHATFSQGDFHSVEGMPLTKMPVQWMAYEPDNKQNNENCIVMNSKGTISDVNCNEVFPYICYRNKSENEVLTECGTIDRDYHLEPQTGNCYKFHHIARNWTRAFMTCAAEGAYLAIINSETEAKIIRDLFAKYPHNSLRFTHHKHAAFVGLTDWGERNVWTTVHGQAIEDAGYWTFENGQPDEARPGEFCGAVFRSGKLDDFWCHERAAFICEKTVDSLLGDSE